MSAQQVFEQGLCSCFRRASGGQTWSVSYSNLTFDSFAPAMNGAYRCVGLTRAESAEAWALRRWMVGEKFETRSVEKLSAR